MTLHDPIPQQTEIAFHIDRLSCAGCVRRAETALSGVDGVQEVSVNLTQARATVQLAPGAQVGTLRDALQIAGYPMRVAQIELNLENLSCASCISRAETALLAVPYVLRAVVNMTTARAVVDMPDGAQDPSALVAALGRAGYPARMRVGDQTPQDRSVIESTKARRAFLWAAALTLPVFVTEMGGHIVPAFHHYLHDLVGMQALWVAQFVLTALVLIVPGRVFYTRGVPALLRGAPDMNSLVALGTGAAFAYSVIATFAPALLPDTARAVYFEAAAVIVTLILLGRWLEGRAKGRTGAAIAKLAGLQPRFAHRLDDSGQGQDVAITDLCAGDRVLVRPGERLPADGVVADGSALVDESMITGEPLPALREAGAKVTGGTVNGGGGAFVLQVTATGAQTVLAQIIRMVELAQGAKLPVQALVDRVTLVFVPVVLGLAALTVAVWLAFGPGLSFALVAGVSVLIIACPCAMGLATPTSIVVGTGRAAELGVLFRKGAALQHLADIRVVAFDKTGTLTEGRPVLTAVHVADGVREGQALALAASLERPSEHPLARALVAAAQARGVTIPDATGFKAVTGLGVRADIAGQGVHMIGSARFMAEQGVVLDMFKDAAAQAAQDGASVIYLARDSAALACFALSDQPKADARATIDALRAAGVQVALITGDGQAAANHVAKALGIDTVLAEVLPKAKAQAVEDLRGRFGAVAFVGDGINDAPALAAADVGIALGTGTDVAIESADIVLTSGAMRGVIQARQIAQATMRNIRQNLFWAFAYNAALVPVAAGVLYPALGVMLSPMLAAGAMALSSVFVLSNALRLRYTPVTGGAA
jgi:P-type Cu+ transporter